MVVEVELGPPTSTAHARCAVHNAPEVGDPLGDTVAAVGTTAVTLGLAVVTNVGATVLRT